MLRSTRNDEGPLAVHGTFSPARAWRPAVVARLARTLGHAEYNRRSYFSDISQPHLHLKPFCFVAHRKSIDWRQDMSSLMGRQRQPHTVASSVSSRVKCRNAVSSRCSRMRLGKSVASPAAPHQRSSLRIAQHLTGSRWSFTRTRFRSSSTKSAERPPQL